MKSLNEGPEQFESLRKLLALKRHEQPPPGYFNELPHRIRTRIEAGEGRSRFWENLIPSFTLRPAVAYGFGLAACAAMALGVYYTSNLTPNAHQPQTALQPLQTTPADAVAAAKSSVNSTNPIPEKSLFDEKLDFQTAPVDFTPKR